MPLKTLFIINPISGGINKNSLPGIIKAGIDTAAYDAEIVFTDHPDDAPAMAADAVIKGYEVVVAVGGDGTIHQVANKLVNTGTALGIIPQGSGNGLARHLQIPLDIREAVKYINEATVKRMDTILCNGEYFVNMAGVGFDAHIGSLFAQAGTRGFKTYAQITIRELMNYKPQRYKISIDGKKVEEDAFLISFANGSQWGNNATIAPKASVEDGLVDICVLKKFRPWDVPALGLQIMLTHNVQQNSRVDIYQGREVTITREGSGALHMDGEPFIMGEEIALKVNPLSLKILSK